MLQIQKQVLIEKAEELERLEVRMRQFTQATRLAHEETRQVSSLLQDLVEVVVQLVDEVESARDSKVSQEVGSAEN